MQPTMFIGIDPGKSGSIAFITDDAQWSIKTCESDIDLADAMEDALSSHPYAYAVIERVSSSPQMGVVSAFSFGSSFGSLKMLLAATRVPYSLVTPAKWQGDMGCRTKGDKNVTKRAAQRLFPNLKITHANADALLLAQYAKNLNTK